MPGTNPYRDTSEDKRVQFNKTMRAPLKQFLDDMREHGSLPKRLMEIQPDDLTDSYLDRYLIQLARMALFSQKVFHTPEEIEKAVHEEYGHLELHPNCLGYAYFLLAVNRTKEVAVNLQSIVREQFLENEAEKWILEKRADRLQATDNELDDEYFD